MRSFSAISKLALIASLIIGINSQASVSLPRVTCLNSVVKAEVLQQPHLKFSKMVLTDVSSNQVIYDGTVMPVENTKEHFMYMNGQSSLQILPNPFELKSGVKGVLNFNNGQVRINQDLYCIVDEHVMN